MLCVGLCTISVNCVIINYDSTTHRDSDNAHGRVFQYNAPDNQNLTITSCIDTCKSQNYTLAGTEYSGMCVILSMHSLSRDIFSTLGQRNAFAVTRW